MTEQHSWESTCLYLDSKPVDVDSIEVEDQPLFDESYYYYHPGFTQSSLACEQNFTKCVWWNNQMCELSSKECHGACLGITTLKREE